MAPADAEIVTAPISKHVPIYPSRAWESDKEGQVTVRVVITPGGDVGSVQIMEALPPGGFEDATVTAVKQWRVLR